MKRLIATLFALLVSSFMASAPGFAAEPQAGRDFKPITPPLQTAKGKIDVVEFFSYGCPHCNDFHPLVSQWAAKLPADVNFRRVPVSFNRPEWARLSRIYLALENTGNLAKLDAAVFIAIHEQRVAFKSDEAAVSWAAGKGVDKKAFANALNSFSMQSQLKRADKEAADAHISGVPALAVDGKYLINNEAVGNFGELLLLTDKVIDMARKERKGK
ncbi:MAG: thiol:disulfide interchange protein DsbA/DsbL [Sulfuritalea sp.]|nr:thiol:disulfide interchange protein DsbA/DsbL [Sulfuritalea sp.]